ncbi:hypothetical protein EV284_6427 [Streptomyces sp. BK022]|uniref:hypothetical protein n=1 Tax=Streptomyces sp. BK022 TaxID=2512123 RepID=UPI0010290880|nr:hypothetical protein [Streptomyces sp. BK022]RZU28261.1 hypothetical protein EV284_6427 [Streptomyces sp. BK022]
MPRIANRLNIEAPDYDALREKAERDVVQALDRVERLDDRVQLAAEIIQQADIEIATYADTRNELLASLYLHDLIEGAQLSQIAGVNKNGLRRLLGYAVYGSAARKTLPAYMSDADMNALAKQMNVRHIKKSPGKQLLEASLVIEEAKARRKAALPVFRRTALELVEKHDWAVHQVAAHTGQTNKLMSEHLKFARKARKS